MMSYPKDQGATESLRAHVYFQEVWPKVAGTAGCNANSESVKFTNKRLDFCQIWLGEYKGPVHLSFIIIDSWFCSYAHILYLAVYVTMYVDCR